MEITRKNFKERLPSINDAINEADFIAIDGEFTGLRDEGKKPHTFDTPEERYHKLRETSMDFLLMQFGMCAFTYSNEKQKYILKAFNFFLFPKPMFRNAPDAKFKCQSSSLDFLASQKFDFNKMIYEGIPYLNKVDELRFREALHDQQLNHSLNNSGSSLSEDSPSFKGPVSFPPEQKSFIDSVCKKIENFLKDSSAQLLSLDPCTGYQRKLIYQMAYSRFQTGIRLDTQTAADSRDRYIVITKATEEEKKQTEAAKVEAQFEELENAVGFTKVIQAISKSGKLVVGHNMLLDLLHIVHQFCSPLPEDYQDFKNLANCVFPRILDTKLMASTQPYKEHIAQTDLAALHKIAERRPFVKPDIEFVVGDDSYDTVTEQLHEAGYDAYITGLSFIAMINFLGTFQEPKKTTISPNSPLLEPFVNKLYVTMIQDIPYMNLTAADLSPRRDHVFHITFPKEWKTSDICQVFCLFGHVYVAWIDDTSAFVSLSSKENASKVLSSIPFADNYKVLTYKDYKQNDLHKVPAHSTPVFKRKDEDSAPVFKRKEEGSTPVFKRKDEDSTPVFKRKDEALSTTPRDSPRPPKKRKSLSLPLNRDIHTIPEEEESRVKPEDDSDLGEPLAKKSKETMDDKKPSGAKNGGEKLFVEPTTW